MSICSLGHLYQYERSKMENELILRDYISRDFDIVQHLWTLTGMGGKERGDDDEVILRTLENGGRFIILEKQNAIIGTAWLTHDFRRTYLHHFCIHPDFQGQSFAHVLMDKCMKCIKEIGYQAKLEVHFENIKAINLYKKYEFNSLSGYEVLIKREIN